MRAQGGGAVVNVSSMAGKRVSFAGGIHYTASKTGVVGFTTHAAFELAPDRIRVCAVCPGPTLSGMTQKTPPERLASTAAKIPLGRWVTSEDVANAILFLASDDAAMCTGTALDVEVRFDVSSAITTRMATGPLTTGLNFLQLQGRYTVRGHAGQRELDFTAPGAAETFRDAATAR